MAAASNGDVAVVQALLAGGADVAAADAAGGTAATYAAASGQASALEALKTRGAKVGNRELMLAASECHTDVVRTLLASGLSPRGNAAINIDGDGDAPILVAAGRNCVETVALLLDKGADVNAKDNDGWTPLIKAAASGRTELARLLLERGADMDVVDKLERTASMYANLPGREEMAALFMAAKAKKP
jgi:ankyrin repeat protein